VFARLDRFDLTLDATITPEKVVELQERRARILKDLASKQDIEELELGEVRKGIITKVGGSGFVPTACVLAKLLFDPQVVAKGVKVGIGAKKTGFVPVSSIVEAYGRPISKIDDLLAVGGRMTVEVDQVTKEKNIILRCVKILEQPSKQRPASKGKKAAPSYSYSTYEEDEW